MIRRSHDARPDGVPKPRRRRPRRRHWWDGMVRRDHVDAHRDARAPWCKHRFERMPRAALRVDASRPGRASAPRATQLSSDGGQSRRLLDLRLSDRAVDGGGHGGRGRRRDGDRRARRDPLSRARAMHGPSTCARPTTANFTFSGSRPKTSRPRSPPSTSSSGANQPCDIEAADRRDRLPRAKECSCRSKRPRQFD